MPLDADAFVAGFDRALRAVAGVHAASRPSPAAAHAEAALDSAARAHAAALMRIEHAGEVCAQALYQGQALTARDAANRAALAASGGGPDQCHGAPCRWWRRHARAD